MNRRKIFIALIIIFVAVNGLLILLDDTGKVDRVSYVHEWSETFEKDMYEKIETAGVLATVNEKNVYFDEDKGSFKEFLVEKGNNVNVGDGLFTYEVRDYYETKAHLESEQTRLNGEITAIEQAIDTMSFYQIPETDFSADYEDENANLEITGRSVDANYMKEQYLAEKEKELAQKNAQLQSIQAQLSELESTGETITVESPFEGEVVETSEALDNPVISIRDMQLQAEGELTEHERMNVEMNMPVEIAIRENDKVLQGSLEKISDSPKTVNIHGTSLYPFHAAFAEDAKTESLLPGLHADLSIITNESPDATVVKEKQIFDNSLWKMTSEGKLHKQDIKTGIQMDNIIEVTKGAESGEWVADEDKSQFRNAAPFVTPLKLENIQWKRLGKYDNVNWEKYFIIGMLSR
ncbi:efflux RND transporter periplasmic adaptor subunit [Virgibacillus doumboii]|uniref:efflux RND transporter periplasmic adaptor subunit n=1 Tax=Virgibacillus doumboii TaxID=2697503 RepID=UPI0013DFD3D0|nr:efflux RND transporter periplasmic adaptor subunit [Virgibacillus doumboii]